MDPAVSSCRASKLPVLQLSPVLALGLNVVNTSHMVGIMTVSHYNSQMCAIMRHKTLPCA